MQPGYNTTETSSTLWDAALSVTKVPNKNKGRSKKSETVYFQEFENASLIIEDLFWRDILHNCARKKFPRGFAYTDKFLHYRINNVCIALPDDPLAFAQTAIYFFQENGKLYSELDRKLLKCKDEEIILAELAKATSNWTIVSRSKNRRSMRIRDYVEREFIHLSQNIRNEIYTQINVAIELGFIKRDNIIFEEGKLIHIDGFNINENGTFSMRSLTNQRFTVLVPAPLLKTKIYRHYENWCKYLEDYYKYILSSAKPSYTIQTSGYSDSMQNGD